MYNFLELEFLKLKRSKIFLLTLLGAVFPSFLIFLSTIFDEYNDAVTMQTFLGQVNMYTSLIFVILLFTIIISYLFGREYNEHTLKTVLTAPTSRVSFILGKYVMFLVWVVLITIVTGTSAVIFGFLAGATGLTVNVAVDAFVELLFSNLLLFLTFSPLVFVSLVITNMIPAMIGGAILTFTNMIAAASKYGVYFPWSCPYLIASGAILEYTTDYVPSYGIILLTFVVGLFLSYVYFTRRDIPL